MLSEAFAREYMTDVVAESPGERRAVELWAWYHVACEAYDRTVCTGGVGPGGGVMPNGSHERALINANASRTHRATIAACGREGVTRDEMLSAWSRIQWMKFDEMTRIAVAPM